MKRFIGNREVNTPMVLMLLAVLTINNGWLVSQTETHTNDLASGELLEKDGYIYQKDDKGDPYWKPVGKAPSKAGSSPTLQGLAAPKGSSSQTHMANEALIGTDTRQGTMASAKDEAGERTKELVKTKIAPSNKKLFIDGEDNQSYTVMVTRECDVDDAGKKRCRVRTTIPTSSDRLAFLKAYGIKKDDLDDSDKNIEACDDCLTYSIGISVLNDKVLEADWLSDIEGAVKERYSKRADELKGKKKKKVAVKNEKSDVAKRIYDCELAEDATEDNKAEKVLKKDEKLECIRKRISELGNADEKELDPFGRKKSDVVKRLADKVKPLLKKCLANEEHREDSGCLDLAESIRDATEDSDIKSVHNISHHMDILIGQGNSTIEMTKYSETLKGLKAGMANAALVAERTGNFGPLQMYQNRLGLLHQQFLGSQLRNEQFLRNLELDPEIGMMNMNDINADYMLRARMQEEFQSAAVPFGSRFGSMNGMRMGMPYGMNPMMMNPMMHSMYPGMMNPMMMNPMMRPMYPGMMNPMMMNPMMMNPMMMNPMMRPYGGMPYPGMMPYGRPPFMPGLGLGFNLNAGFGVLPTNPPGQYGNWPPGYPGAFPGTYPGAFPGGFPRSPTAGYYPPFQAANAPTSTINTR
ncbi:MAG: hypothetical protein A4S09_05860 [Proteobacteria bacterium SG_bin7]|nr:MAG: hypothetical protein A4S09_05860 [Proteobacteria bacterium SG_bin7]